MELTEFIGVLILPIFMAISTFAGMGGGGLVIPLSMALFSFRTKNASAISSFCMLCVSVTRFIYTYKKKHP